MRRHLAGPFVVSAGLFSTVAGGSAVLALAVAAFLAAADFFAPGAGTGGAGGNFAIISLISGKV